jgi:Ferritin-like
MAANQPMDSRVMSGEPIPTIDSLKHHLYLAMQLEHATIPPYLTTLYSIKPGTNVAATEILRVVAVEEMLHLVLAANILNAIDGTPRLTDPDFVPRYPAYLPNGETDFEVHLQPFSREALETFLNIERPSKTAPSGEKKLMRRAHPRRMSTLARHPDPDLSYYSIGDFYLAIEHALARLEREAKAQGQTIFAGTPGRQVTPEHYYSGGGKVIAVTNLETAQAAVNAIIGQGEGEDRGLYGPEGELAHYYRFKQLKWGRYYQRSDNPPHGSAQVTGGDIAPTGPKLEVRWDAHYKIKPDTKLADYDAGSEAYRAAEAFNQDYANFLRLLERAFNGEPEILTAQAVPMMLELRNKVNQLMRNPLKSGSPFNAAPTFEMGAPPLVPS